MNRVDRLIAIALHLQSRRVVRAEDLATHFEISVRTVYRDLAALGEAGVPIIAEAGVGYSLVKGYHLPPVMFTAEEATALFFGEKLVEQFTDASLRKPMHSALLKIRSVLPRERQDHLDHLERRTAVVTWHSEHQPRLSSEALIPLQRAVAGRRVLLLTYQGLQRRELTQRAVEPLALVYYAENWHLIAYCRLRQGIRDFRTDRIQNLELLNEQFTEHTDFSLKQYLESVMHEGQFKLAQIRFLPEAMERVKRDRFWGIVEQVDVTGGVEVTLLDHSLELLASWVLSFGSKAEVLGPKQLRDLVTREVNELARQYALLSRPSSPSVQPRPVAAAARDRSRPERWAKVS